MKVTVKNQDELIALRKKQTDAIRKTTDKLKIMVDDPRFFENLKFEKFGHDPSDPETPMNLIEQINLTATYVVALKAVEWLMKKFPLKEWSVKPGPSGAGSDIESLDGEVCGEVFAAVVASSNDKLTNDVIKVSKTKAKHKFVFCMTAKGEVGTGDFPGIRIIEFPRE